MIFNSLHPYSIINPYYRVTMEEKYFFRYLLMMGEVYFMGGYARALYDYSNKRKRRFWVRDIDIVINVKNNDKFKRWIQQYPYMFNKFGGYKIETNRMKLDIWEIQNTWAYRQHFIECPVSDMGKNLPSTVFLNYDSLVYYLNRNKFYDEFYRKCIKKREIDVVLIQTPELYLNLLRVLEFKMKTNFSLSVRLKKIFSWQYKSDKNFLLKLSEIASNRRSNLPYVYIENEVEKILMDSKIWTIGGRFN